MTEDRPKDEPAELALPTGTPVERVLDVLAALSSIAPLFGGVVSAVLSGLSGSRRFERIRVVLFDIAENLDDLTEAQEEYIQSEDFEDLLTETLQRVARERSEDKRVLYRRILQRSIADQDIGYDETLRFVQTLEALHPLDIVVMRAFLTIEEPRQDLLAGSRKRVLLDRLPELSEGQVNESVEVLGRERVLGGTSLDGLVTGPSASDLRPLLSDYGDRFVSYLGEDPGDKP